MGGVDLTSSARRGYVLLIIRSTTEDNTMSINRLDHMIDWYEADETDMDMGTVIHPSGDVDLEEFRPIRSSWGDAPFADELESLGVIGWTARGAGNSDPYVYLLRYDDVDDLHLVALVDYLVLQELS